MLLTQISLPFLDPSPTVVHHHSNMWQIKTDNDSSFFSIEGLEENAVIKTIKAHPLQNRTILHQKETERDRFAVRCLQGLCEIIQKEQKLEMERETNIS